MGLTDTYRILYPGITSSQPPILSITEHLTEHKTSHRIHREIKWQCVLYMTEIKPEINSKWNYVTCTNSWRLSIIYWIMTGFQMKSTWKSENHYNRMKMKAQTMGCSENSYEKKIYATSVYNKIRDILNKWLNGTF